MPKALKTLSRIVFRVVAACVGLGFLAGVSNASPDWSVMQLRQQLTDMSESVNAGDLRDVALRELTQELDWPGPRFSSRTLETFFEPETPASLEWSDIRYGLAALNQAYGAKDSFDILRANIRGENLAMTVESGVATMGQLEDRLTHRHLGLDINTRARILRTPIVIKDGATLRLGPNDVIDLSRRDGAFILNFGRLEIYGSRIAITDDVSPLNDEFVPFISSVGTGTVHVSGASFKGLGFGKTAKFSGFSMVSHPTMRPRQRSVVEHSRFEDLVTLAVVGQRQVELRDNRLFDMRRNPLLVSRSPEALVSGNLFAGPTPTNAIRVSNGSSGVRILDNVILEGSRAGMLVSSTSDHVEISGNLIWRRDGGGVKLQDVSCGRVLANLILDDRQKGVEIRSSAFARVEDNRIIGNKGTGLMVAAQRPDNITFVFGNLLRENGAGVATATGARIALFKNDLSNQFPRLLDGDITQQFRAVANDLRGQEAILLDGGGSEALGRHNFGECQR